MQGPWRPLVRRFYYTSFICFYMFGIFYVFCIKAVFFQLLHAKPCRIIWKLHQKINFGSPDFLHNTFFSKIFVFDLRCRMVSKLHQTGTIAIPNLRLVKNKNARWSRLKSAGRKSRVWQEYGLHLGPYGTSWAQYGPYAPTWAQYGPGRAPAESRHPREKNTHFF